MTQAVTNGAPRVRRADARSSSETQRNFARSLRAERLCVNGVLFVLAGAVQLHQEPEAAVDAVSHPFDVTLHTDQSQ